LQKPVVGLSVSDDDIFELYDSIEKSKNVLNKNKQIQHLQETDITRVYEVAMKITRSVTLGGRFKIKAFYHIA